MARFKSINTGVLILATLLAFSFSVGVHSLTQHSDVSIRGAEIGQVLGFNGRGWVAVDAIDVQESGNNEILFAEEDSIASENSFRFSRNSGPGGASNLVSLTGGANPEIRIEGTTSGRITMGSTSNRWQILGLTTGLRINPLSSDGSITIRNAANIEIFNYSTSTALLDNSGVINSDAGFQVANAATTGEYLRGNGTNFVSSTIQESDLPTRPATDVTVADAGGYFTGTEMEAVTQEIGADLYTQSNLRNLLGIEIGNASGTPDVNGNITVTHSLGVTPTVVLVTGTTTNTIPNSDKHIVSVVEKNTTNFVVRIWDETGSPATGTVTFDWQAIE